MALFWITLLALSGGMLRGQEAEPPKAAPPEAAPPEAAPPEAAPPEAEPPEAEPQEAEPRDAAVTDPSPPASLRVETLEARLAALEADPEIEQAVIEVLKPKYSEAIEKLKSAVANRTKADSFREAIQSAPGETTKLQRQREELSSSEEPEAVPIPDTVNELRDEVVKVEGVVADLEASRASIERELAAVKDRPVKNADRLPAVQEELVEADAKLAALPEQSSDPAQAADRALLEARREALVSESDLLMQERLSQSARESLLGARRDLLSQQLESARASLVVLEKGMKEALKSDGDRAAARIEMLAAAEGGGGAEFVQLVTELRALAADLQSSALQLRETDVTHTEVSEKFTGLKQEFKRIEEQIELGGLQGTFAQVLVELRRRLPNARAIDYSLKKRGNQLREVRLAGFRADDKLDAQVKLEKRLAGQDNKVVAELVVLRREILEKLTANYQTLISALALLDADERAYQKKIIEIRTFLNRETFWKQSSPRIGFESLATIPAALNWLFGAERWREAGGALRGAFHHHPVLSILVVSVVMLLLVARSRIIAQIELTGRQIRRVSKDRYRYTAKALGGTILLVLPIQLALGFLAWVIRIEVESSDWMRGIAAGLRWASLAVAGSVFLQACCRPKGLGIVHFGWDQTAAGKFSSNLLLLFVVYLPALIIVSSTLFEDSSQHFDGVGRLIFNLAHVWVAFVLWRALRPSDGVFASFFQKYPKRMLVRGRYLWISLIVLVPIALVVLSALGYVLTAFSLSLTFLASLGLIAGGAIFYGLVLRWFMIKERRLALTEALEKRRARREMAAKAEEDSDEGASIDEEELELDLVAVGTQTRRLLRSLTWVGIIVAIWILWARSLPIGEALDQTLIGELSLLNLGRALLVLVVFSTLVRNLPGLLELGGLRGTARDAGTRHAITTICQYGVIAVGALLLSKLLHLDWSQFGWIAAALSVGLGFGLQEVVANFVCGIILLFERPIRVGDIVTIENVDGTVTRIQMRATTITNWDRKEFVVPNKLFITGTLMNWTLSNSINRVLLPVGVAYGTDTRQARQILTEAAADHPGVLNDPAPLATFEQFADNTLNLNLRCFLAGMDNRVAIISDLHTAIDERFKDAGIEIAFPQQDLHLRSVDPQAGEALRGELRSEEARDAIS